ncbi:glutathione S-transferase [Gymnodinialimonas hymeniacidonis]|uniref:glutathione S-transferase n=1 Tax=Gymnodinialimonas hymeniacidonis TaxID=3126508 RepID=UPI0034C638CA
MTYSLLIGQKSYSSWSLRGYLSFAPFDIPVTVHSAVIYSDSFYDDVADFGAHRTVPAVRTPEGGMLTDSLAIGWHLAEAFPDKGLLPADPIARAEAQSIIAEMHSGFTAIRGACPMNLRTAWAGFEPSPEVLADVARIEEVWTRALNRSGGPFLYGDFTLADAFYAPVVTRLLSYGLPMSDTVAAYAQSLTTHPSFLSWRAEGLDEDAEVAVYDKAPLERIPFPTFS